MISPKKKKKSKKIFGTPEKPRVVISRSNLYLTAQAIDDVNQKTLAYLCTREIESISENNSKNKKSNDFASKLASEFSKILVEKNLNNVVFDSNGYRYHGRVKTFREGMQKLNIKC